MFCHWLKISHPPLTVGYFSQYYDEETYLDTLLENSFLPLITLPTRIGHNSETILDHICTNIADDSYRLWTEWKSRQ